MGSRDGSGTLLAEGWVMFIMSPGVVLTGSYQVEGEAQGSDEKVKKFLQRIDKGPSMAHVVKLEKRDLDVRDDEEGFAVMRTAESMFKPGN